MLRRPQVEPFLSVQGGELRVRFLEDSDGRVTQFLDRLLRLMNKLEGHPRPVVREALGRQERRVHDARRLDGISRTLLSIARFRPPEGAERAPEVRRALFEARGADWPPVPGDEQRPCQTAGLMLDLPASEVDRLLYADQPDALRLVRAPTLSPGRLLHRYNLELARAVLLDAESMTVEARGGWKSLFRAIKLARLMHSVELVPGGGNRSARRYRVTLTGPASSFVSRPRRYGVRFARVIPALVRAPGWSLEARIDRDGHSVIYRLDRRRAPQLAQGPGRRSRYDSAWEEDLARAFRQKIGTERDGWTLHREESPVQIGASVFLPDFTLRHVDGRVALVELVGFWTPEYLTEKLRKVRAAGLGHLVLVVFRGLAAFRGADTEGAGGSGERFDEALSGLPGRVVWFQNKVRIGEMMEAVEAVARRD